MRFSIWVIFTVAVLGTWSCSNFAKDDKSSRVLSEREVKLLLLDLPYHYKFRKVKVPKNASGALAGVATTARGTFLNFGVALGGDADPVPVPKAGTNSAYGYPDGGFVFTDDLLIPGPHGHWHIPKRFHGRAEWNEAGHMGVTMQEKLCKAVTNKPCPP